MSQRHTHTTTDSKFPLNSMETTILWDTYSLDFVHCILKPLVKVGQSLLLERAEFFAMVLVALASSSSADDLPNLPEVFFFNERDKRFFLD